MGSNEGDDDYPIAKTAPKDPNKPLERRKVEIQILHMSDQSQQMVSLLFVLIREIWDCEFGYSEQFYLFLNNKFIQFLRFSIILQNYT